MKPASLATPSALQGAPNFRDLGGLSNAEGRSVRRGVIYRSEVLSSLGEQDQATLARLDIGAVFDLRNSALHRRQGPHRFRLRDAAQRTGRAR